MRVTEKGQVTIPKNVRDHLGIKPGSEVDFIVSERGVTLVSLKGDEAAKRRAESIRAWADRVSGVMDLEGMRTDEFMELLRGPRDELGPR